MSQERSVRDVSGLFAMILVEPMGFEPTTSSMPSRRAPNCATAPPRRDAKSLPQADFTSSLCNRAGNDRIEFVGRSCLSARHVCPIKHRPCLYPIMDVICSIIGVVLGGLLGDSQSARRGRSLGQTGGLVRQERNP